MHHRLILLNHIPRTGGTTLRIILNRVYGEERIFFIRSKSIASSLEKFSTMNEEERARFRVITGHGALLFEHLVKAPFRITVLREPVSLFISQYHYLKSSPNSNFLAEVSSLNSLEDYISFALENGQDNMLTRFLSGNQEWLISNAPAPDMAKQGSKMLEAAKAELERYDTVIDLADFDRGVYALSEKLGWKRIPVFRAGNKGISPASERVISSSTRNKLEVLLQYDIALYDYFKASRTSISNGFNQRGLKTFLLRQKLIEILARYVR